VLNGQRNRNKKKGGEKCKRQKKPDTVYVIQKSTVEGVPMSFPLNDTVEKAPLQESLTSDSWEKEIVPLLPEDLEESAWLLGAMTRKGGKIQSASDLLRGIVVYAMCVTSFQALGAWGVLSGVADLADTSWRDRVRKSDEWLYWVRERADETRKAKAVPKFEKSRIWTN
jgi:hypothetical protein